MTKKLSRDGYTILKSDFTSKEIKTIKDDLTAKPYTMDDFSNGKEKRFYLYLESPKKLYLPRFYGLKRFGKPDIDKIGDGETIDINFKGGLREEQKPIFDVSYKQIMDTGGGIVSLKCGGGKTVLSLYILSQISLNQMIEKYLQDILSLINFEPLQLQYLYLQYQLYLVVFYLF